MIDRKGYTLTKDQRRIIGGIFTLPHASRVEFMQGYFALRTPNEIISMFSNYIDMAETVRENTLEQAKLLLICSGLHPADAEKFNEPSIYGAIKGLEMAGEMDPTTFCEGCAFRKGSVANTCLVTVTDAEDCNSSGDTFMCHENLDGDAPTRKCRGFLKKEKDNAKV